MMLLFDILAAIWDQPRTSVEIAQAIQARSSVAVPAAAVEHHVGLLHGCGYLLGTGDTVSPLYSLTAEGSALLARLAAAVERTEHAIA